MVTRVRVILEKYTALVIGLVAAAYYGVLCAKSYTWVFISGDSGDWLAASTWWMVPQPYGSPLYILSGQFLNLFPGDLTIKMTVLLSVMPSAVTIALVYCIVMKLVGSRRFAVAASLVLLGATVFMTQSTVLEEYALATMLLTLGFWAYINGRRYLTAVCWGLGMAIHAFIVGAVLLWLIVEWRGYIKPLLITTVPIVAVFYGFILLLMYFDTPRLMAGGLNVYSLNQYLTVTTGAILGQLSIFEAPGRFLLTGRLLLMSFGVAIIPLAYAIRKPIAKPIAVMLGIVIWTLWYQVTNIDPAAWTFLTYASPFIAVLVGLGLSKIHLTHLKYVVVGALALVIVNSVFLNADKLTNERPLATTYYNALESLPDGSVVLVNPGSYSLGLFYVMSTGKDLTPLVYPYLDNWEFDDYRNWLNANSDLHVPQHWGTLSVIDYALLNGSDLYYADSPWRHSDIRQSLVLEDTEWVQIKQVTALTGLEPASPIKLK